MRGLALCVALLAAGAAVWIGHRTWPRPLEYTLPSPMPQPAFEDRTLSVRAPSGALLACAGAFQRELSAYLHFQHLRSLRRIDESRVLLTSTETPEGPSYRLFLELDNDLLTAVPYLAVLVEEGYLASINLAATTPREAAYRHEQTAIFVAAYNLPVRRKLETLSPSQLQSPMARFILFKSKTDPRVRRKMEPVPEVLSLEQAEELAADIIAVAHFYGVPLDFFLGIGAIENDYMDVPGDLEHTAWKRRAEPGDIVLARRRGRVLVRNFSIGVWQITRETLRYAHKVYLEDEERDYCALPERLRPPQKLDLDNVSPPVLTTYAGLLFRDLLDHFEGDVEQAVGAYNGGVQNPNLRYAAGVGAAASHARKILEQAAALNGQTVSKTQFLRAPRPRAVPASAPAGDRGS